MAKQVDILISKNQALQMLYLKHHVYKIIMDKKLTKSKKNCSPQNKQTYPAVRTVTDNTIKQNIPYICPGFIALDNVITSLCTLIRIRY